MVSQKISIDLPNNPAILFLDADLKNWKQGVTNIHSRIIHKSQNKETRTQTCIHRQVNGNEVWCSLCVCLRSATQSRLTLRPRGLCPTRLLCPWDFPGKNTGMGCHSLLQGIFPTQESNLYRLHWQADFLRWRHLGSPYYL